MEVKTIKVDKPMADNFKWDNFNVFCNIIFLMVLMDNIKLDKNHYTMFFPITLIKELKDWVFRIKPSFNDSFVMIY